MCGRVLGIVRYERMSWCCLGVWTTPACYSSSSPSTPVLLLPLLPNAAAGSLLQWMLVGKYEVDGEVIWLLPLDVTPKHEETGEALVAIVLQLLPPKQRQTQPNIY